MCASKPADFSRRAQWSRPVPGRQWLVDRRGLRYAPAPGHVLLSLWWFLLSETGESLASEEIGSGVRRLTGGEHCGRLARAGLTARLLRAGAEDGLPRAGSSRSTESNRTHPVARRRFLPGQACGVQLPAQHRPCRDGSDHDGDATPTAWCSKRIGRPPPPRCGSAASANADRLPRNRAYNSQDTAMPLPIRHPRIDRCPSPGPR